MKQVFKKIFVTCKVCGTPVDERYKQGEDYFCLSHFQQASTEEKLNWELEKKRTDNYHKMFGN